MHHISRNDGKQEIYSASRENVMRAPACTLFNPVSDISKYILPNNFNNKRIRSLGALYGFDFGFEVV